MITTDTKHSDSETGGSFRAACSPANLPDTAAAGPFMSARWSSVRNRNADDGRRSTGTVATPAGHRTADGLERNMLIASATAVDAGRSSRIGGETATRMIRRRGGLAAIFNKGKHSVRRDVGLRAVSVWHRVVRWFAGVVRRRSCAGCPQVTDAEWRAFLAEAREEAARRTLERITAMHGKGY